MFDWFKHKAKPPQEPQGNLAEKPEVVGEPKPLFREILPMSFRLPERAVFAKVVHGFCAGCNRQDSELLAVNHTSCILGCSPKKCSDIIVKVSFIGVN